MAMILEHTGHFTKALEKWRQLKTEEGAKKTVSILRKKQIVKKDTIFEYLKWVLEKFPDIGLSLFIERLNYQDNKSSQNSGSVHSGS